MNIDLQEVQKLNSSIQLLLKAHNRSDEDDHSAAIQHLFECQNVLLKPWRPVKLKELSTDIQSLEDWTTIKSLVERDKKAERPIIWKPIPGQAYYEVSNFGALRWKKSPGYSKCRDYVVSQTTMYRWTDQDASPSPRSRGGRYQIPYSAVKLYQSGRNSNASSWHFVDVLVLEAFHSERAPGAMPIHENGNSLDNSLSNLKWPLPAPVSQPSKKKRNQKLSDAEVSEIKLQLRQGVRPNLIACIYNVHITTIYAIKNGTSRRHIV